MLFRVEYFFPPRWYTRPKKSLPALIQGDSGGPLVCDNGSGHYDVVGVVSFGQNFCTTRVPGILMEVSQYISWIEMITGGDLKEQATRGSNFVIGGMAGAELHALTCLDADTRL